MNKKDYNPGCFSQEFDNSPKLNGMAETCGKNLLIQWGFKFSPFEDNKQFRKFWDGKENIPDLVVEYNCKKAFINWKGKRRRAWQVSKYPIDEYEKWKDKLKFPFLICFAVFDRSDDFQDFRFAVPGVHKFIFSKGKSQYSNEVIEFEDDLPEFTKADVIKHLL